jgi:hypothetical protein
VLTSLLAGNCLTTNSLLYLSNFNSCGTTRHHWWLIGSHWPSTTKSKSKLCYDRQTVGQSALVSSPTWGSNHRQFWVWWCGGVLSNKRMGLSFTSAAGPHQRSHSQVLVLWDSIPYFTVSAINYSSQSQSHIATDGQSVCLSWCQAPAGAHDQMFLLVWKLLSCPCGAPSLTRGRVCHLSAIVSSISPLSFVQLFTILLLKPNFMYNIYKASVSPGSVQQTMPYF